jgi:hypothetical protein
VSTAKYVRIEATLEYFKVLFRHAGRREENHRKHHSRQSESEICNTNTGDETFMKESAQNPVVKIVV